MKLPAGSNKAANDAPIKQALAAAAQQLDELRALTKSRYAKMGEDLAFSTPKSCSAGNSLKPCEMRCRGETSR